MSLVEKISAVIEAIGAELKLKADADSLAAVATSGSYNDLDDKPSIPAAVDALTDLDTTVTGSQLNSLKTKVDGIASGAEVNVNADWNATTGDSVILNKPDVWESLTAIPSVVTADLTMTAGQYAFVDGSETVTISAPASPAHGDLLGLFIGGSGGTVTFDGNGASVVLVGIGAFPLLSDGDLTITQSTWSFDAGQECWMVVSFGTTPEVASLGGAGETGRALMGADDPGDARTVLGLATVATSGSYNDLDDKPVIPGGGGGGETVVHVSANYTASSGDHVVVDAEGYSAVSPALVTLPADPADGATVTVSVTGAVNAAVHAVVADSSTLRVGEVPLPLVPCYAGTSTRLIYSEADETWNVFSDALGLSLGLVGISTAAIYADGEPDGTTFLRGDGAWVSIERNPVAVEAAHTAAPGEDVYCITGGYTVTIPDGDQHGQIITVATGPQMLTSADVDVEFFYLANQVTAVTTLPSTGARITLQWFQDIDFDSNTVSGWIPTTVATIDTTPAMP